MSGTPLPDEHVYSKPPYKSATLTKKNSDTTKLTFSVDEDIDKLFEGAEEVTFYSGFINSIGNAQGSTLTFNYTTSSKEDKSQVVTVVYNSNCSKLDETCTIIVSNKKREKGGRRKRKTKKTRRNRRRSSRRRN